MLRITKPLHDNAYRKQIQFKNHCNYCENLNNDVYDVMSLIIFVAYDVCRAIMFVAYDICRIMMFVAT